MTWATGLREEIAEMFAELVFRDFDFSPFRGFRMFNPESSRRAQRDWYERNRDRKNEYKKSWRKANAEHLRDYARENRDRINRNSRAYRARLKLRKAA